MKLLLENWRRYLKEEQEYEIYCDMDGVLVDFERGVVDYITTALAEGRAEELKAKIDRDYITTDDLAGPTKNQPVREFMYKELQHNAEFWENLPWIQNGPQLWATLAPHNPNILTTPMGPGSERGKQRWINKHLKLPDDRVFFSREKYEKVKNGKYDILIDDFSSNTIPWKNAKGTPILHTSAARTKKELRDLGLELPEDAI